MISISLCMIVKNEEETLERCLSSVRQIVDEMIIVDTGSTDRTKEIAEAFQCKIYDFTWIDDFAAARNYAFSQATQEYILWLDADDEILEQDQQKFLALKAILDPAVDSVMMPYHLGFDHEGNVTAKLYRNRLVKRSCGYKWEKPVHEYLAVSGNIMRSDIAITHKKEKVHTDRNLRIYRKRALTGEIFDARDLYYFANELRDNGFAAEAAEYYLKFLATKQGWSEDCFAACMKLARCYQQVGERQLQLRALFRSLLYGPPRAEMCCQVGAFYLESNEWERAVFWYETATTLGEPRGYLAMVDQDAWTWLPHLQLCLCYDRLGNREKARYHHEQSYRYHPTHPSILYNQAYFARLDQAQEGEK